MSPELITALLGAGGLAAILPKLIDGLRAWRSGRAAAEKDKNRGLVDRLSSAESRAEYEATWRRTVQEYASTLRVLLIGNGVPKDSLPAWPDAPPKEPTTTEP